MGFEFNFEMIARKVFQCDHLRDPFGRLSNNDNWSALFSDQFSEEHKCMAWTIVARLQSEYLKNFSERKELYDRSRVIEREILHAGSNMEIIDAMLQVNEIVNLLGLTEDPHFDYTNTNDNLKYSSLV